MSDSESMVNAKLLKEIWQEYLKSCQKEEKEKKLEEVLSLLVEYQGCQSSSSVSDSELASIGNLLGCELLKVINHQCEILEHDSDLIHYLQEGWGLYLLQALHILADKVNSCNSEVSNVLASLLPCLLTVPCEFEDNDAFVLLQQLSMLYNDISSSKKTTQSLYRALLSAYSPATNRKVTVLQLLALVLDIIARLSHKNCSLAVAESSLNVAEKLTTLLLEFSRDDKSRSSMNFDINDEFPECTWSPTVKLVCICMLLCVFWTVSVRKGSSDAFSHRIDQSELVCKLLDVLRRLKNSIWHDSGFKTLGSIDPGETSILAYRLFLTYSVSGLLLTLLKKSVSCEGASVSGLDLTRKFHSKEQVENLVKSVPDLLVFVSLSLSGALDWGISLECSDLLRQKAVFVIRATGQLISTLKKAMLHRTGDQKLSFSLERFGSTSNQRHRESRCSRSSRSRLSASEFNMDELSSDSDREVCMRQATATTAQPQRHSSKDCVVSRLCSAVLSAYEVCTVEEIDAVCLNSLSRCGTCSCMDVSVAALALLSRFVKRSPHVQDTALGLFCKTLLGDSGLVRSNHENNVAVPAQTNLASYDEWLAMERLFLLATEHGVDLTVKILKHSKALVKFGSSSLREALFSKVILPIMLKYKDKRRVNVLSQVSRRLVARSGNPHDSGYATPTETSERETSESEGSDTSQQDTSKTTVSDEALRISLTSLLALLQSDHLQNLFLESDGVKSIVNFLGDEQLHLTCLKILQLLAMREDKESADLKFDSSKNESMKKRSREIMSEGRNPVVTNMLLRSMLLLDPSKERPQKLNTTKATVGDFSAKVRIGLKSSKVSRSLCQLWRTCLELLRRNTVFRERFVQSNGLSYAIAVLQVVKECLYKASSESDDKLQVIACITLMEHAVAVGLEFEKELVDGVQVDIQINEAVRIIERLIHKDKILKGLVGKVFCGSLLSLAVGSVTEENLSLKSDIRHSEKLLFHLTTLDDSGSESDVSDNECSKMSRVKDVEPGYEADIEQDNGMSDLSSKEDGLSVGQMRQTEDIFPRRRSETAQGHICCPQMCELLVNLMGYDKEMTVDDRSLVMFALEGMIALASYSIRNREILCDQGILFLVLKTFAPCLTSLDVRLKAIQKTVLDLIVILAGYKFTSEELRTYLKLMGTNEPDWGPLTKALRTISSLSVFSRGPTYTHVFPAETRQASRESPTESFLTQAKHEGLPEKDCKKISSQTVKEKTPEHRNLTRSSSSSPHEDEVFPSPWNIRALTLKLNQSLPWPVGGFSLAFWLNLDSGSVAHADREHGARIPRGTHSPRCTERCGSKECSRKFQSESLVHVVSFGSRAALFEVWVNVSKMTLICRWSGSNSETGFTPIQETIIKFPVKDYVWYHLVLSVRAGGEDDVSAGKVTLIVDGSSETTRTLPYPSIPVEKNEQVSLLIGEILSDINGSRSFCEKLQPRPFCRLGNLATFIGNLHREGNHPSSIISLLNASAKNQERLRTVGKLEASFLQMLGPNCQAIDFHLLQETSTCHSNHLDLKFLDQALDDSAQSFLYGPHGEAVLGEEQQWNNIKISLKKQLVLVYSPVNPTAFLEYKLEGTDWFAQISHTDYVTSGKVIHNTSLPVPVVRRECLVDSIHNVGGIGVFLYLFAKAVETTKDERTQADALSVIFAMAKENIVYAKELEGLVANKMILKVLLTPSCTPGCHFVKVFLLAACEGEVLRETGLHDRPYLVNLNTTAIIKNYEILRDFLLSWRIWYRTDTSLPWETVLRALEALTCSAHPYAVFNIKQFERADALGTLLLGCQEIQAEELNFSTTICSIHLNIVQNLLGCPANPQVLKRVCEFLVAIHPTYETVLIHAPANLYLAPIAKLRDRDERQEIDANFQRSPRRSADNEDETTLDGKQPTNRLSQSRNEATDCNLESRVNITNEKQELVEGETTIDIQTSEVCPSEITRANVLNTDDSKDMIISVEHLRKNGECTEMAFPLQTPELHTKDLNVSNSEAPVNVVDNTDFSSQQPLSESPKTSSVHQDGRKRSDPIKIDVAKAAANVAGSYDVVSSSEFNATESQSLQTSNSSDDYLVVDSKPSGFASTMSTYRHYKRQTSELREHEKLDELRVGLLELIYSALVNLPDTAVVSVLGAVLKPEYFLCFVNHSVARIRTLSIKILHKILERGSPNIVSAFHQISGYHLLAVQIHLHPITQELAEACFVLFFQQPVSINQPNFPGSIKSGSELARKINVQAIVLLLGMFEGATSCPEVFQFLTQSLVRVFDVVEDFLLKATDHGLLKTFINAVRALCVWKMNNSGERGEGDTTGEVVLDNLQYLVMAIVYRSLRMCGDRYYQIFDDLLLFLDRLQYSEPGNKRLTMLLFQCSRFLQFCALRFALEYFEYTQRSTKLNRSLLRKTLRLSFKSTTDKLEPSDRRSSSSVTYWATLDPLAFPVLWQTSRRISLPAEATPTEVTNRFQDVCKKAVSLICFSDSYPTMSSTLDLHLNYSRFILPPPFEAYKQNDSSLLVNASKTFTQWIFCFLLERLYFCLNEGDQFYVNKWHELVHQSKDKIRHQLCRLFIYLMSPSGKSSQKYFALQLTKMKRGDEIFLNLVLGAIATKQKERAVAYVRSFLREPGTDLTPSEVDIRNTVVEFLKHIEVEKLEKPDDDWSNLTLKQQEWARQDRNNKIQWENKKEVEQKRSNQELYQLCQRMMSVAMDVTKVSVDVQDKQRQNLLKHVKGALSSDVQSQKLWQVLVKQMTHERAVWHDKVFFPTSWQLDRTEGPSRVRSRLQRCHLDLDEKYLMPEYRKPKPKRPPLSYLFEESNSDASSKNVYHIFNTTDTIRFLHRCKSIMPARKVQGEILIGEKRVYFVGEETVADLNTAQFFLDDEDVTSISWLFQEIREILRRRYALKDNALEIFLTNGRTFLLAFETTQDRETVYKELIAKELPNLITATENVMELTQRWQNGELTNFAYLTELNKQACRSFNDLMQYPVFPLVLAEYSCDVLDLTNRPVYRDLSKPIAVQNPSKVAKFQETYRNLQEQYDISKKIDPMNCIPPYHYGSHYSNSGTVLHFLVRLVPFTKMFLAYQDKQFDVPDRTFHAIETTWNLSSRHSSPDVKELVPEFFFLPEFLLNSEGFDFGLKQTGERVNDVLLPSWACNDARLFILIHRQALESDIVSSMLSKWIDLVFGFKQEGQAAVEAINVFHPSTYVGGIDENRLLDPLQRQAVRTMIETYGQTPARLFTDPHPDKKRSPILDTSSWSGTFADADVAGGQELASSTSFAARKSQEATSPLSSVYGIKWGYYVGSPSYPTPVLCWSDSFSPLVSRLVCLPSSHLFLLPANSAHMIVTRWKNKAITVVWSAVLTWNHVDDIIRIRDFKKVTPSYFMENMNLHKVTCCAVSEECRSLWVGSSTGCLCVWPTRYDRANECGLELLGRRIRLQGHQASIICVEICEAFSIVVTGSDDKTAIIWDLNRLCYIRCLDEHPAAVSIVTISPTSGDIVTVCQKDNTKGSELRLWSVNGRFIKKTVCIERITCVQFSQAPEGVSVNAVAAGLVNGIVRLWNTWTLEHMCDIKDDSCQLPIVCLAYSFTCHHLFTVDSCGTIRAWGRNERASYKPRVIDGAH